MQDPVNEYHTKQQLPTKQVSCNRNRQHINHNVLRFSWHSCNYLMNTFSTYTLLGVSVHVKHHPWGNNSTMSIRLIHHCETVRICHLNLIKFGCCSIKHVLYVTCKRCRNVKIICNGGNTMYANNTWFCMKFKEVQNRQGCSGTWSNDVPLQNACLISKASVRCMQILISRLVPRKKNLWEMLIYQKTDILATYLSD